ncbi:MAG: hypothetical protein APF80_04755 [Alphaproteobacteria bacterium BRH_c36]|nr:MAG: hypothetical protein APF80_04755 [Alphaproteobacteria bacterium BRH_c36]
MMLQDRRSTAGQRFSLRLGADDDDASLTAGSPAVRFSSLLAATGRHLWKVALWALLVPVLAAVLFLAWPKSYQASTRLLVDPRGLSIVERDVTPRSEATDQLVSVVESELRIVTSDTVLKAVIEKLNLTNDPEFNGSERFVWSPITDFIDELRASLRAATGIDHAEAPVELTALRTLGSAVKIEREPQSFIIDLSVRTNDAEKSARITNAIAEEYLTSRFSARSAATERASATITGRLDELRKQVEEADDKVESYKRAKGIIGAGGQLVNEQQLAEVNTQLGNARDEVGRASARVEQIRALRDSKSSPEAIPEAINSQTITQLRALHAAIQQRYAAVTVAMLPAHPEVKQVRQRLDATESMIAQEIDRIAATAQLDLKRARDTERAIERRLSELKQLAQSTNENIVHLRELEREAEARRSVYTNLLLRSRELDEQKRVDPSLAIVLSPAVPPQRSAGPPMSWVLAASLLAGLGLGVGYALSSDYRDRRLRTAAQSQDILGYRTTIIPAVTGTSRRRRHRGNESLDALPRFGTSEDDLDTSLALKVLASEILTSTGKSSKMVLITSPDEGRVKSTIALNLAVAAADLGERVLLIDGDCETRTLTVSLGEAGKPGLENLLDDAEANGGSVSTLNGVGIDFLTNGQRSAKVAASRANKLEKALSAVLPAYDMIVVDGGVLPRGRLLPMLVGLANEVILVSSAGVSEKASLVEAVRILEQAGVERLRPVLIA